MTYVIGIDVGTKNACVGVFNGAGVLLAATSRPIATRKLAEDFAEQSSRDIWEATCDCVCGACADATCSLVVIDAVTSPCHRGYIFTILVGRTRRGLAVLRPGSRLSRGDDSRHGEKFK